MENRNPLSSSTNLNSDEYFFISPEGMNQLRANYDGQKPSRNISWTTDINAELPIRMKKEGRGSKQPYTVIEA